MNGAALNNAEALIAARLDSAETVPLNDPPHH